VASLGKVREATRTRQLRSVVEPITVVVRSPSQCLDSLVKILKDLSSMLESPNFVLTSPSLLFSLSFPYPSLLLALPSPSLGDEATCDADGKSAQDAGAGDDKRHLERCATHTSIMGASRAASLIMGHIRGTWLRDLSGNAKNCRHLSSRSDGMQGKSNEVRDSRAQDPAYRPTCKKLCPETGR
jgi:hypothetical protein